MANPARRSSNATRNATRYGRFAVYDGQGRGDMPMYLQAGERIGGPPRKTYHPLVKAALAAVAIVAGCWAWLNHQATVSEWADLIVAAASPMLERKVAGPGVPAPELAPLQPMTVSETETAPGLPETSPLTTAALSPGAEAPAEEDTPPGVRLPQPVAEPGDPYQARALAVGLHPGLSRVVLSRLSEADYRNAGIAIKTALAETPDTEVFVWPRQRTPKLALFQVKFVPGAAPGCRRYVVTVTLDGWLTTALPMENCEAQHARQAGAGGSTRQAGDRRPSSPPSSARR